MISSIILQIRDMLKQINPNFVFEYDEARMINVKVDTVPRDQSFIYIEELASGQYNLPYRGYARQQFPIRIYFCRFEEMHNDAWIGDTTWSENSITVKRTAIRDIIEEKAVRPFLYLLKHSDFGMNYPSILENIRVMYPRARFDANEVSVCLEFTLIDTICLDNYKSKVL